ncbi:hypothetical protein DLM45_15530 [Hyphomicrobium methylovorum]|uniref:NepR family anti-sigma factor n=1 Tax=Hyphomicrobium methylovorum TaxID=84 RepID=UPI0015E710D1|nr:NepR family anti-sigma factor [Hyphomicrobium methylovorum]MBA2127623.1 hypothetical protein [Hyphomicrobium methylovorum]
MQQRFDIPDDRNGNDPEITEREEPIPAPEPELDAHQVAKLPGIATQLIGERIRSMYAVMVSEAVPDELLQLIRQLESKE